ncbi:putative MFS family arabinose efflux permease [Diaminobutyricimonas aerilata]|uniref:Putative MFS family arabinose efflux permease n=1 Tax=Diaminobutyricimonas aerilata TaxID=1162967 RepID=A0A2M9CLW2_9MICO|nr:MFS transporter [Diaminobutyricimonas aerilata]PJJ72895.1 putative MFS family arabinose efflux permease [Diaminobutyricimonas aerilata]
MTSDAPRPDRGFGALWIAAGTANLGDGVVLVALPLIALLIGSSPAEVAAITVIATAAWPVLGLHAGWIVDRVPRRGLLVTVNAARAAVFGAVGAAALADALSFPLLAVAAAVFGVTETLADTALVAAVPELVVPQRLTVANARLEATTNIANQLAGPPLAGVLVAVGASAALATGGALYAAAAASLAMLGRAGVRSTAPRAPQPRTGVLAGLRYLWRHDLQRPLTLLTASMNLVWGAWTAVFVLAAVAPGPLALSSTAYGLVLAAMAVGGVLASTVVGRVQRRLGTALVLLLDCVGTVLLVLPVALGAPVWVVVAGLVVAGAGASVWRVLVATIRQRTTPSELLGRVYAASRVLSWGAVPVGAALAGAATELVGLPAAFLGAAVLACLNVVAFPVLWLRLARYDRDMGGEDVAEFANSRNRSSASRA